MLTSEENTLGAALDKIRRGEARKVIVLENDLYRRAPHSEVSEALEKADSLLVLDQLPTKTTEKATLLLPATSFSEHEATGSHDEAFSTHYDSASHLELISSHDATGSHDEALSTHYESGSHLELLSSHDATGSHEEAFSTHFDSGSHLELLSSHDATGSHEE